MGFWLGAVVTSALGTAIWAGASNGWRWFWRHPLRYPDIRGEWAVRAVIDDELVPERAHIDRQLSRHFRGKLLTTSSAGESLELELRGQFYDRVAIMYQHVQTNPSGQREFGVGIIRLDNNLGSGRGKSVNIGTAPDREFVYPEVFDVTITRVKR